MKSDQRLSVFFRRWRGTFCSAAALLIWVILLFLFPRKEYPAVSTVFAILFWLSIAALIVCTTLAVRNKGKTSHDRSPKQNRII